MYLQNYPDFVRTWTCLKCRLPVNVSHDDHHFLTHSRKHDMLVCPVCDYVDLVRDRFKMHLQTHGLPATDLTSLVRESERDFTTLLSCGQPGCSFTTAYKHGLVTHQAMEHRLTKTMSG